MRAFGLFAAITASALAIAGMGCNAVLGIDEKHHVDAASPDAGSFVLSLTTQQSTVRIVPGQSASVDWNLQRSGGFSGPVSVLVSGLPRDVTVDALTFAPTATSGTLTFHAADTAELGSASLSVTAASATLSQNPVALSLVVQGASGSVDLMYGASGRVAPSLAGLAAAGIGPGGLQLLQGGTAVLCGYAKSATTQSSVFLARLSPSGGLDPTFGGTGFITVNSDGSSGDGCTTMFVRPSGGVVFAGWSTPNPAMPSTMMSARFSSNGNPSADFGQHGFAVAMPDATGSRSNALLGVANDSIIVGGSRSANPAVFRILKSGMVDNTFVPTSDVAAAVPGGTVRWLAMQSTGAAIAAIESTTFRATRVTPDGLDTTFGTGGVTAVDAGGHGASAAVVALVRPDDSIVLVGTAVGDSGSRDVAVAFLTSSGQLSAPDGGTGGVSLVHLGNGDSVVSSAALQADGSILVAGQTPTDQGPAFTVARLLPSGARDTSFGPAGRQTFDANGTAQSIAVDELGRIVVAGASGDGTIVVYRLWP